MNVLSLFDGISCGRVALERAGIKVEKYYSSEVDKYAMQIANKNYPQDAENRLGDVVKLKRFLKANASVLKKLILKNNKYAKLILELKNNGIDLIIGGSPCQGFSKAGLQLNFNDPRSKLFFEYVEVLEILNPKYFLLENVDMKQEWRDVISGYLGVKPIRINSSLVSAQKRDRLYWTNIANIEAPSDKNIKLLDILENEVDKKHFILRDDEKKLFEYINNELRIRQATKKGYDIANIGDSINLSCPNSKTRRGRVGKSKCNTLDTSCNYEVCIKNGYKNNSKDLNQIGYIKENSQGSRFYDINGKSVTLKALGGGWGAKMGLYLEEHGIRKITPIECERLQTLPDNYTEGISDSQRYKCLGNGWTVDVIAHIFKNIEIKEIKLVV